MSIEVKEYTEPGFKEQIDYNGWRVAIANYMPSLEIQNINFLERHLKTDEVFVLINGNAGLLVGVDKERIKMEPGKLYNVKAGTWHRIYMQAGAKVVIVENADTGKANTEYRYFS